MVHFNLMSCNESFFLVVWNVIGADFSSQSHPKNVLRMETFHGLFKKLCSFMFSNTNTKNSFILMQNIFMNFRMIITLLGQYSIKPNTDSVKTCAVKKSIVFPKHSVWHFVMLKFEEKFGRKSLFKVFYYTWDPEQIVLCRENLFAKKINEKTNYLKSKSVWINCKNCDRT